MNRAHLIISGRVQGVFFRANTQQKANQLNITGWVKNRWDGKVEAVIEGEKNQVEKLIMWCHHGPAGAIVEEVEVTWEKYQGNFDSFSITW